MFGLEPEESLATYQFVKEHAPYVPQTMGIFHWIAGAAQVYRDHHLQREVARRVATVQAITWMWEYSYPRITSAYRPPLYQRYLQRRWDAGDREGLTARPASRSWHMVGRAIDVDANADAFWKFRDLMLEYGFRWGGDFTRPDDVHFDLPGPRQLTIDQLISEGA